MAAGRRASNKEAMFNTVSCRALAGQNQLIPTTLPAAAGRELQKNRKQVDWLPLPVDTPLLCDAAQERTAASSRHRLRQGIG